MSFHGLASSADGVAAPLLVRFSASAFPPALQTNYLSDIEPQKSPETQTPCKGLPGAARVDGEAARRQQNLFPKGPSNSIVYTLGVQTPTK